MPRFAFTNLSIRNLKADERTDYWDTKTPGLGVRVGIRSKVFVAKVNNRRHTLGAYPRLTLQEARRRIFSLKADTPTARCDTALGDAIQRFLETHCSHYRPKSRVEITRLLGKLSHLNRKKLSSITTEDIHRVIDAQRPSEGNHLFKAARTFFRWTVRRRYIINSPVAGLSVPNRETARTRVLADAELKRIWDTCDKLCGLSTDDDVMEGNTTNGAANLSIPVAFCHIVKLLILTGQRRGEIAALQRHYLDLDANLMTLPPELTKNKREHMFPIGLLVSAILAKLVIAAPDTASFNGFLFPARGKPEFPFNGWSKSKDALDTLSGVKDWTLHDLRRTYATMHASIGTPPHIVERLLNHASGTISGVAAIYNRFQYRDEMRAAVAAFDARIARLIEH